MPEHMMTSQATLTCLCGAGLYEDDHGRIYCEEGGRVPQYGGSLHHSAMCYRDEEGNWTCAPRCAVYQAQIEMPL